MADRELYNAGWVDGLNWQRDFTKMRESRTGWGMLLMLFGSILIAVSLALPFAMWIGDQAIHNPMPLVYLVFSACAMITGGYFLDKRDEKRYKQRETDFYKKWADRWDELGFSGDE